jgi:hypothetical protein
LSQRRDPIPAPEDTVNIDTAARALDRAQRSLDRASSDGQRRSAQREVDRCAEQLRRAEGETAAKLERQGYEVTPRRRW